MVSALESGLVLQGVAVGALHGVDLRVAPGEIVCLSGPSGSGKSRLLRAIADLEPHDGDIGLNGQDQQHTSAPLWRTQVMLLPAESRWWFDRVGEHFPHWDDAAARALGLAAEVQDWEVARLSSGEKQRLALLRALAYAPSCLLLDEPTANLDADSVQRVEQWLLSLICDRGMPTLWVAHDSAQIERVARRHLRINDGRVQA